VSSLLTATTLAGTAPSTSSQADVVGLFHTTLHASGAKYASTRLSPHDFESECHYHLSPLVFGGHAVDGSKQH
jgi:hypothetical protein